MVQRSDLASNHAWKLNNMSAALLFSFEFRTTTCCVCGIAFAFDKQVYERRIDDHQEFYCPKGHSQHFNAKSEKETLKEQLEMKEKQLGWANQRAERTEKEKQREQRRVKAYKGVITKTRQRVANGICPCCTRSFQNLHAHMKTKHPKYGGK